MMYIASYIRYRPKHFYLYITLICHNQSSPHNRSTMLHRQRSMYPSMRFVEAAFDAPLIRRIRKRPGRRGARRSSGGKNMGIRRRDIRQGSVPRTSRLVFGSRTGRNKEERRGSPQDQRSAFHGTTSVLDCSAFSPRRNCARLVLPRGWPVAGNCDRYRVVRRIPVSPWPPSSSKLNDGQFLSSRTRQTRGRSRPPVEKLAAGMRERARALRGMRARPDRTPIEPGYREPIAGNSRNDRTLITSLVT